MLSVVQLQVNPKPLLVQARVGQGDDECSPSLADAIQGPAINAAVAPRLRDHRGPGVSGPPPEGEKLALLVTNRPPADALTPFR